MIVGGQPGVTLVFRWLELLALLLVPLLGYERYDGHEPWLVRVLVHRLLRGTGYLRWSELELADGAVHPSLTGLPPVPAIA